MGFEIDHDVPLGVHRWLTVTGKNNPDGTQLLLDPSNHKAVAPYKKGLYDNGIAVTSFRADDLDSDYERLCKAVAVFRISSIASGPVKMAMLYDGCGNLVQLIEVIADLKYQERKWRVREVVHCPLSAL